MLTSTIVEIELKYHITDAALVQRLLSLQRLGPFTVHEFTHSHIVDTYYDTPSQRFFIAHYAFRHRQEDSTATVQIKSLGHNEGARHQRTELRARTTQPTRPDAWPDGLARQLALEIMGREAVAPLFVIEQVRHRAHLLDEIRGEVAQLSVDEVTWQLASSTHTGFELEIELLEAGTEEDLQLIQALLGQMDGLRPAHTSKFERGLRLLQSHH